MDDGELLRESGTEPAATVPPPPGRADGAAEGEGEPGWLAPALLLAAVVFLYMARRVLAPFVVAGALAYVFFPLVGSLERRTCLPRVAAVVLFLLLILVPLAGLVWAIEPTLVRETKELALNTPEILRRLLVQVFGGESIEILGQTVGAEAMSGYLLRTTLDALGTPREAFHVAAVVFEAILHGFLSLVLLFYFLLDPTPFARAALRLVPPRYRPQGLALAGDINHALGLYVRGLAFLVLLMSTATWIGLALVFHLPYALPIALATGFLEIIPFLGPVLAGGIACVVALSQKGVDVALQIALFYLVLRQLEDQLVMPNVLGRAVELHPVMAIFAVLAGSSVAGVLGALLAIPVAAALKVAYERWRPA